MRAGWKTLLGATLVAPALILAAPGSRPSVADDLMGRFGRLFRFGGGSSSATVSPPESEIPRSTTAGVPLSTSPSIPGPDAPGAPMPRLIPQPRVSRATTDADPLVTRIALARSNEGGQFGMFLQIFADGTVIDSEGTHHLDPAEMKPLHEALQSIELYRQRGHCGAPATDFVEQVYVIVYERSLGRLRANAFSYSGNPEGCDRAVHKLHAALDGLQAKFSHSVPTGTKAPAPPPTTSPALPDPSTPALEGANTIPLTPLN